MKRLSQLGFGGWLASIGLYIPGMPLQCIPDMPHPGVGGGTAFAGGGGADAGSPGTGGITGVCAASSSLNDECTNNAGTTGQSCTPAATPVCGNGCVEFGEECDGGMGNGSTQRCDDYCFGACEGPCPIRVNPAAATNGAGRDWSHPANQIQNAIDRQAARGGGEIWIAAGDFDLNAVDGMPGFTVASNVTVLGGFVGDAIVGQTILHGVRDAALLRIESATHVVVEGIALADGDPAFRIVDSQDVTIADILVVPNEMHTPNGLEVTNSSVRFDLCSLSLPMTAGGLVFTGSDATLTATNVSSPEVSSLSPNLVAEASRLLIQDSRIDRRVIIGTDSDALIIDSTLPNTLASGAALNVNGRAAAVGTTFGLGYGDAAVRANGSALIFDSDFRGYATVHRTRPVAWAIAGSGTVVVSLSSFIGGACFDPWPTPCPAIESGTIDNSFFVYDESFGPRYTGGPFVAEDQVVLGGPMPATNCVVAASRSAYGSGGRIVGPYPCVDQGEAVRLLATQRLLLASYAAPFMAAPFNANLGRYLDYDFWRSSAVSLDVCDDVNAPDPGRHYRCDP